MTVEMQWDEPDHKLILIKGTTTVALTFDVSDTSSPGMPFKLWEVVNHVPNCLTAPNKPSANISALFGNLKVNSSGPVTRATCLPL